MVIISPVDELASSHPPAADAAGRASQPPASNPEPLFDNLIRGTAAYNPAAAGTVAWSPHPPYASTATSSGGFDPSSSPLLSGYMMDPFSAQPPPARIVPPAMAEPSYYYSQPIMMGFSPAFAPGPFAQGVMPPPVLVPPMQTTSVEPAYYYPQSQGAAASAGEEAATVHAAVPDTQKAQETTAPTPRRRGRPRKTAAPAATSSSKPMSKTPKKRATARSNRAASQQTTSVTSDLATMAGQIQVQKPEQASGVAAASTSDAAQPAPCRNPMPPLLGQEQWRLQSPSSSSSLSAGGQAAAVVVGQQQEVMLLPYAYAETSAPGVRFRPTDEDLIFFLRLKHAGREIPVRFFKDFDVYQASPEACKAACGVVDDDGCWYAFSPRDRKYKNGVRPKRSVVEAGDQHLGYWKSNTKLSYVLTGGKDDESAAIGNVTSLTFHVGHQPRGTQTPWKMKEYAIPENEHAPDGSVMRLNDWVVCKLFYKKRVIAARRKKKDQPGKDGKNVGKRKDQSGKDGKNVGQIGGAEGTQMMPADQSHGDFEQDLCVEDYPGYDDAFAEQNHAANGNIILHRQSS